MLFSTVNGSEWENIELVTIQVAKSGSKHVK